uniref:Peptidase C1A papain C-terminal domain-containing protein n=1 Tax=Musca domestica TaxID=7370 RepID=A0A1I8MH97_MUSDO
MISQRPYWILTLVVLLAIDNCCGVVVSDTEWNNYKLKFGKTYANAVAENNARFYYAYNVNWMSTHNSQYDRGLKTFKLRPNQFTDMRLIHFNAMFPVATAPTTTNASPPPNVNIVPPSYDPSINFGYTIHAEDQGLKCNSGWSYSAVKAIEILNAIQTGNTVPSPLSAQQLIDCAGRTTACTKQVPQTVFDYLKMYDMPLLLESEYKNNNSQSEAGMCLVRGNVGVRVSQYSMLTADDDEALKKYVGSGFPVIVEINPTSFEFMHYSEGIYEPPVTGTRGSHFMTVIGYGTDKASGLDYWLLLNSFDTTWGERGFLRLRRSSTIKLAKNAIFPTVLG